MNKYIRLQTLEEYGFKLKINFQDSKNQKSISIDCKSTSLSRVSGKLFSVPIGFILMTQNISHSCEKYVVAIDLVTRPLDIHEGVTNILRGQLFYNIFFKISSNDLNHE